jgi:Zn-dependent M28 family amino/carboxypeptidase
MRIRSVFTSLVVSLLLVHTGAAQQASPATRAARAVNANVMRAHLEFLADDALEGRKPGTRGGDLAAKYIAAQFERLGLEPAGDSASYFQRVPIISLTPRPTLRTTGPSTTDLRWKDDFVLWSMRNDSTVHLTGDAVFVGYGIVAPEEGWNDYDGVDAKGKIVIALVNDPGLRDSTLFRGKILTYYGRWTYKIEEARRQGAAGILLIHTEESATYPWSAVQSGWTGPQVRLEAPPSPLVVAGWLHQDAAARIFKSAGKDLAQLSAAAAKKGFRAVPLGLGFDAGVQSVIHRSTTANVIARWPGRGPHAQDAILIGGHYDHFGIGAPVNGDSIYNGAEDNASGTAAVLTAAEAFVRSGVHPGRSVVFVAFTAEEAGLLGSEALATDPPFPLKNMAAMLNLDEMNVYGKTKDFSALGLDQSSLGKTVARAAAAEGMTISTNADALVRGFFFRSDHFPFVRAGVPGASLQNGEDYVGRPAGWGRQQMDEFNAKRYHQPQDNLAPWFNYEGAVQQLRVTVRTAIILGDAPTQPTWNPTSEFRQAGLDRLQGSGSRK